MQPAQFLPTLKNDIFLFELTELTIKLALKQIDLWDKIDNQLTISINIGASQLEQREFFGKLKDYIKPYPESISSRLELEILESSIISNFELTSDIIHKCNSIGIQFLLDDFGSEYSSINYLVNLPFKYMKIDTSFILNIIDNEKDTKILMAILEIAKAINIKVIVEGVETEEHMHYLINLGCDLAQGYAISRPMPAEEFPDWYEAWNRKNHPPIQ